LRPRNAPRGGGRGSRELAAMRRGFVYARAETAAQKPAFRDPLRHRRSMIGCR